MNSKSSRYCLKINLWFYWPEGFGRCLSVSLGFNRANWVCMREMIFSWAGVLWLFCYGTAVELLRIILLLDDFSLAFVGVYLKLELSADDDMYVNWAYVKPYSINKKIRMIAIILSQISYQLQHMLYNCEKNRSVKPLLWLFLLDICKNNILVFSLLLSSQNLISRHLDFF